MNSHETESAIDKGHAALELIRQHRALVQVLGAGIGNDRPFQELVKKLDDPENYRPVKIIDTEKVDPTRVYHPRLGFWQDKPRNLMRGRPKPTTFTKKVSLSLLPTDGQMLLYRPFHQSDTIALLYEVDLCHLKDDKYIFPADVSTNTKWWLKQKNGSEVEQIVHQGISLSTLREMQNNDRKSGKVPVYNDINAGISKGAFFAIACTADNLFAKINAIKHQRKIRDQLGLDLPILILSVDHPVRIYELVQQEKDLILSNDDPRISLLLQNDDKVLPRFHKQKLLVKFRQIFYRRESYIGIKTIVEYVPGKYLGRTEPGKWESGSWGNQSWKSIPHFHRSDGYYARDSITREVEGKITRKIELHNDYTLFLYEWSEPLRILLDLNIQEIRQVLKENERQIDDLLSGLYEIQSLLETSDELLEPSTLSRAPKALLIVNRILAEWGYHAIKLPSHLIELANRNIQSLRITLMCSNLIPFDLNDMGFAIDRVLLPNWLDVSITVSITELIAIREVLQSYRKQAVQDKHLDYLQEILESMPLNIHEHLILPLYMEAKQYLNQLFTTSFSVICANRLVSFGTPNNYGIISRKRVEKALNFMNEYFCYHIDKKDHFYRALFPKYINFLVSIVKLEPTILANCCEQNKFPTVPEFCAELDKVDPCILDFCCESAAYQKLCRTLHRHPRNTNEELRWNRYSQATLASQLAQTLVRYGAEECELLANYYQLPKGLSGWHYALSGSLQYDHHLLAVIHDQHDTAEKLLAHIEVLQKDKQISGKLRLELKSLADACRTSIAHEFTDVSSVPVKFSINW